MLQRPLKITQVIGAVNTRSVCIDKRRATSFCRKGHGDGLIGTPFTVCLTR
jgi:hypothetical protein